MISAEIEANNAKVRELADEKGMKVAQNVAAGVANLDLEPVVFGGRIHHRLHHRHHR